jgi:hypothetical protein
LGFTKFFPEVFEEFRCVSVFELLKEYIETGRIKLDKSKFAGKNITIHWELVSECVVMEPWSEEEVKKSLEERDAQYERDGVELEEEEY